MEALEIEVFLALAQELHFTRTAERLRLSQSRVSRLVSSLERRVGGPLFERTSRQVALTPLGKQLRDRAGPAWEDLARALADARVAADKAAGTLRAGWPPIASGPALAALAERFVARNPECHLAIYDVPAADPYGPLRRGEIDVLACWLAGDEPGLTAGPVIEYQARVLAVSRGHRLARRATVSAEDLAGERVHGRPLTFPVTVFDALCPPAVPSGRPIARTVPWRGVEELVAQVVGGQAVHPTVAGTSVFRRDDIRLVPIRDLPPVPLGLLWRAGHENAAIRALATACRATPPARRPGALTGS